MILQPGTLASSDPTPLVQEELILSVLKAGPIQPVLRDSRLLCHSQWMLQSLMAKPCQVQFILVFQVPNTVVVNRWHVCHSGLSVSLKALKGLTSLV